MKRLSTFLLVTTLATSAMATAPLPFVEDDFVRARAEAARRKLPLFVDVWAPW